MRLIVPIIIFAVCVSTYFVYIQPVYSDIQALSAKKAEYLSTLQKSKDLNQMRDSITESYNSISTDDIRNLWVMLPSQSNNVSLAFNISAIASKYGLVFNNFKTESGDKSEASAGAVVPSQDNFPYETTLAQFQLRGQYGQVVGFLRDLESNLKLMDVVSISIKSQAGITGSNSPLDVTVQIKTYSLRQRISDQ
jgi:Tfp pilus assembly protein PilO